MKLIISSESTSLNDVLQEGLPDNVSIKLAPRLKSSQAIPPEIEAISSFILEWSQPIAQGVIAAWIYDKTKNIKDLVKINKTILSDNVKEREKQIKDEVDKVKNGN